MSPNWTDENGVSHFNAEKPAETAPAPKPKAPAPKPKVSKKKKSRVDRWSDACARTRGGIDKMQEAFDEHVRPGLEDLIELQSEYQDWLDNLPENLQQSAVGEKLQAICDLQLDHCAIEDLDDVVNAIDEAEGIDLPRGFGKD
jgi:hypothetical protein